ncbi:phenylalanine 4-monooxygenase [Aestuariibacter sp. A3R04]|uniref:phenylalanine 4-monooxygenase n=1 Tax=Aestuariibacter sp. A3R04 TaxID=2841571 RepID=UPI001C0A36F9|nr:phenylalanine 4-monooxygenase [Aestuariibacter sp. A3R04]MBU3022260.1 phenylalanine 4-monooxygenase [Aestuariibacter sp. A3R04]
MAKTSKYHAKNPGPDGQISWGLDEHKIWKELFGRQVRLLPGRACEQYLHGLSLLDLPSHRIPQLCEIDAVLEKHTGWRTAPVPALINFSSFFELLANKQFPVATFIRSREEFDYLQEPDIFHEVFGHCPLLTNTSFAHFTHTYGKLGLAASKEDRIYLARLYWFTVEFGLVNTPAGTRIYGGGILSSPGETLEALESQVPVRVPMNTLDALRTPYRIDIMQPLYYVLSDFDDLFTMAESDIMGLVKHARKLGLFEPLFTPKSAQVG